MRFFYALQQTLIITNSKQQQKHVYHHLVACISAVAAVGIYAVVTNLVAKTSIRKRREAALKEAEAEGEMIKKEKILQAKEKFIQLKSEYDRQVNERNQKIAQSEQRAKQIEGNLQNQQRELENKLRENERLKEQMQNQLQILEHKKEEVDQNDARAEHAAGTNLGHELGGCQEHPHREHEGRGQDRGSFLCERNHRGSEDDRHEGGQTDHRGVDPARSHGDGHRERRDGLQHRKR